MTTAFEDKYLDVLQNIECGLLSMVEDHPALCDYDMLRVIEHAQAHYKSQQKAGSSSQVIECRLAGIQRQIFERVKTMCDWRLGKRPFSPDQELSCSPISLEELLLCLKRIEKSIMFWTKQGGRKGYIAFVKPRALV